MGKFQLLEDALKAAVKAGDAPVVKKTAEALKDIGAGHEYVDAIADGLDVSHAARMKRADELYPVKAFHGGKGNVRALDDELLGGSTGAPSAKRAHFAAEDASTAGDYAHLSKSERALRAEVEADRIKKSVDKYYDELATKYGHVKNTRGDYLEHKVSQEELARLEELYKQHSDAASAARDANLIPGERFFNGQSLEAARRDFKKISEDHKNKLGYIQELEAKIADGEANGWKGAYDPEAFSKKLKLELRVQKETLPNSEEFLKEYGENLAKYENEHSGANVMPLRLRMENPLKHDFKGKEYRDVRFNELLRQMESGGYDGTIFQNTYDPANPKNRVKQDIYAVPDASNIRGRFAMFNPKKLGSKNILDSIAPIAAPLGLGYAATGSQDAEAASPKFNLLHNALSSMKHQGFKDEYIDAAKKGLDMSYDARMARTAETGHTIPGYHGTSDDITEIDPKQAGRAAGFSHDGVSWVSSSPEASSEFAIHAEKNRKNPNVGPNVMPVRIRMQNPYVVDAKGGKLKAAEKNHAIRMARAYGHDGVRFDNLLNSPNNNIQSTVYAIFEPSQMRSEQAAFDPAKKFSPNILHAAPAAAVAGTFGFGSQSEASEAIKNPLTHGVVDVGSNVLGTIDKYAAQGPKAAVSAAFQGKSPLNAYLDSVENNKETSGWDVAKSVLDNTKLGFPTPAGGKEYSPIIEYPLAAGAELGLDLTNLPFAAVPKAAMKFPKLLKYLK